MNEYKKFGHTYAVPRNRKRYWNVMEFVENACLYQKGRPRASDVESCLLQRSSTFVDGLLNFRRQ